MRLKNPLNLLKFVFLSGLFISPFVFWPWAKISFEIPKVWVILRWIEILSVITLLVFRQNSNKKKIDLRLIFFVILFLVLLFISSLFGQNFYKSFWGNYYRSDGLYTLIHLVIFFLFTSLVVERKWIDSIIKTISYSAAALSAVFIVNAILFYVFDTNLSYLSEWYGVPGSPFGNPNFLAGFLLITLPLTLYLTKDASYAKAFIVLQIIAVLLTQAWAGIFGILLFILGSAALSGKKLLIITSTILIIILGFFYFKNSSIIPSSANAESRQRIFIKGILSFIKKPLLGWGWANFDYAFDSVVWPIKMQNDVYVDKAHSILLETMVTSGVTGLIIYLAIVARTIRNLHFLKTPHSKYLLFSFLLFIIHSQTNVISVSEELIFWLLTGISASSSG